MTKTEQKPLSSDTPAETSEVLGQMSRPDKSPAPERRQQCPQIESRVIRSTPLPSETSCKERTLMNPSCLMITCFNDEDLEQFLLTEKENYWQEIEIISENDNKIHVRLLGPIMPWIVNNPNHDAGFYRAKPHE